MDYDKILVEYLKSVRNRGCEEEEEKYMFYVVVRRLILLLLIVFVNLSFFSGLFIY